MASRPTSPVEPTQKYRPPIQPNAHPYAIKTTSSALLSRWNSSPHYANPTRHHYVPLSPSRVTTGTRVRHRHSASLSSVEGVHNGVHTVPAPLPTPPPAVFASDKPSDSSKGANEPKLMDRVPRAGTIPSSATSEPITELHEDNQTCKHNNDEDSKSELYIGLSPNPRGWTTDELATYLESSLKSGSNTLDDDKEDNPFVDILAYVRTRGLTGRELLRLTNGDLAGSSLSDVQRAQLLEHSRALRAGVLRGRTTVDPYHAHNISYDSDDIYTRSVRSPTPFRSVRGASMSTDDLCLFSDNNAGEDAATLIPSPAMTLHRSNSVSDASAQRYRDLARMRMRRRGRVKGLVETWERASTSGSECSTSEDGSVSGSEAESESEPDPGLECVLDANDSPEPSSDRRDATSYDDSTDAPQEPPSSTPPPPYTPACTVQGEEEPSMEELLASTSSIPLKGARAWEADFGLGETVKRIPASASTDVDRVSLTTEPSAIRGQKDDLRRPRNDSVRSRRSMRGCTGSRGKDTKTPKRVVTAIFTGSPTEDVPENVGDGADHRRASDADDIVGDKAPASSELQNDSDSALQVLEASVAATRAQMDALRVRLERVEADTARQEAALERAQHADVACTSGSEPRQRRLEASVQATETETAEHPKDKNILEAWETLSLGDIRRALVARAMRLLFPDGLNVPTRDDHDGSQARGDSRSGVDNKVLWPAKRGGRMALARESCGILLVSFAICATVLRRMGFGRWARRP